MKSNKVSVFRWLTLGGVMAALGSAQCGSTESTSGTETHWLTECAADAECGDLRCHCGVCTEDCSDDDACEAFGDAAVCSAASTTDYSEACAGSSDPKVCVRDSDLTGDGGTNSTGGNGGTSSSGSGGDSSGTTGGTTGEAGSPPMPPECYPQYAQGVGTGSCETSLGVRWNGEACEGLFGCECEGEHCGDVYETYDECAKAHTSCFDNESCYDERQDLIELLNANKSCSATSDCIGHFVGCGVSEDGCTGAVYSNDELDAGRVQDHAARLSTCSAAFEETGGCGLCERVAAPPECIEGRCVASNGNACALQQNAMASFIGYSNACETVADCTTETVGCGVSQDDCTGAVYLNQGFDREEFEALRDDLFACGADFGGGCDGLCEREVTPVTCEDGFCQPQ